MVRKRSLKALCFGSCLELPQYKGDSIGGFIEYTQHLALWRSDKIILD